MNKENSSSCYTYIYVSSIIIHEWFDQKCASDIDTHAYIKISVGYITQ